MNQKKLQILLASKELFFKNGFSDTSVSDIIKLANVSKGTFYNHFSSKNECMIAIFHDIHETSVAQRNAIVHFHNKYDSTTLEQELIAHFKIIIESNIMDIMANNISSKEQQDIFNLIKSKSLREIEWLGNRLIDIYGLHIKNKAYDFAAMILGSIQQITLIRTIFIPSNFIIEDIVTTILKQFEPSIYASRITDLPLIPNELFTSQHTQAEGKKMLLLEELIDELALFYDEHSSLLSEESKEYTQFLIETLTAAPEKKTIIKSLSYSFLNSFKDGPLYNEALSIFQEIQAFFFD